MKLVYDNEGNETEAECTIGPSDFLIDSISEIILIY
jgi:hypothetical protein